MPSEPRRQTAEPLLSPAALAELLDVPLGSVYRWRSRGEGPPGIRVGKHVRYRPADVAAWLDAKFSAA